LRRARRRPTRRGSGRDARRLSFTPTGRLGGSRDAVSYGIGGGCGPRRRLAVRPPKSIQNPVPSRGLREGLRIVNRGGARGARDSAARPGPQIERMLGAAAGTDGLHDSPDMPVAVTSLDVDAAAGIIRSEQYRRLPAATLPAEQDALRRNHVARWRGLPSLSHRILPLHGIANQE
jgi:hypothetical protein